MSTAAATRATYLGFDFGLRRIGVAVGEAEPLASFPLTTLAARQGRPDWAAIGELVRTWRPAALVVGVPLHLDGACSPLTRSARRFSHQLRQRFALPVHEADERLSSRAARELQQRQRRDGRRRGRTAANEDKIAASLILNDWLANHHAT